MVKELAFAVDERTGSQEDAIRFIVSNYVSKSKIGSHSRIV